MTSARLLCYAFDYNVTFTKVIENQNVECLSRAPLNQEFQSPDTFINEKVSEVCATAVSEIFNETLRPDRIAQETERDENLYGLKLNILKKLPHPMTPYKEKIPIKQKSLLRYQATPLANGKTPAELYLFRNDRIKLDAMLPYQERKSDQELLPRTRSL
ncbi:hypothetical protein ILUMI_12094 [Ignelater luminosus]|uniref:Uncharacterized protein n=1 Tax=Ignelater luminosus TaxID=2038154 RepID=A0A8K0CUZ3_IGNLU|nr:hypothetical protein ILUMI_12094 [Ignelater luminosus]